MLRYTHNIALNNRPPFGSCISNRGFSSAAYRYGFNGKEKETDGTADNYDFGARIYDGRLGRWLSVDPQFQRILSYSPYNYTCNKPLVFSDYGGQILWDPINQKEIVFNDETKMFLYKDGTFPLCDDYLKQAKATLDLFNSSEASRKIAKNLIALSTKVVIDENHEQKNSEDATTSNSLIKIETDPKTGEYLKNDDGLYEMVTITPLLDKITSKAAKDGVEVGEKFVQIMTVESGHIGTAEQIALEASVGGSNVIYNDGQQEAFAKVYNSLLNAAVRAAESYRREKYITVDSKIFLPITRVQASSSGAQVTLDTVNALLKKEIEDGTYVQPEKPKPVENPVEKDEPNK